QRAQRLWAESAIAQRELDERVNGEQEADANLRAAQAALQSARLNLDYTQVRAPVSGRVGRLEITVGNLVAAGPGAPVLTTLVSVNPIYASFDADEHVVLRALKEGKRDVPVEAETVTNGGTQLHGRLQLIDNQVNTRSGTVRVRAVFDNKDGSLIPGQIVKLRMGRPAAGAAEHGVGVMRCLAWLGGLWRGGPSRDERYLGAAVDLADLERRMRVLERAREPIFVTFNH